MPRRHVTDGYHACGKVHIMEGNENYEELKWSLKQFLQVITSNKLYYGLFLLAVMIIAIKVIDLIFLPFRRRRREGIAMNFLKWCLKAFVIITIGMKIISLSDAMSGFTSQILMSSSLIVVVLGFIFQEGLSNIVHGFILTISHPFNIGDRVHITVDGESITGYIDSMDLRSTIIRNVINSSHVIVPNAKMDLCVIDNNYFGREQFSSNFLDVTISYESDLEKAIHVISEEIQANPLVRKLREQKKITAPVAVLVREFGDSGIALRASVETLTVEENFAACSDIRRSLALRFKNDPDLDFAYPHVQLVR